jgi:rubrerythrin
MPRANRLRLVQTVVSVELLSFLRGLLRNSKGITKGGKNMLSQIPINFEKIKKDNLDQEILRVGLIAELDAINLYQQLADMTENANIKKILLDIAKEEKTHVGEFQALLLKQDKEQRKELEEGEKEVDELTKGGSD